VPRFAGLAFHVFAVAIWERGRRRTRGRPSSRVAPRTTASNSVQYVLATTATAAAATTATATAIIIAGTDATKHDV